MPRDYHTLSLAEAHKLIETAIAHVEAQGLPPMAIVVVDRAGQVIASSRMDGLHPRYVKAAHRKAYTGAIFERSPRGMNDMWTRQEGEGHRGPSDWNDSMLTTMPGGFCILNDDGGRAEVVGGIGVAGTDQPDEVTVAEAALKALGEHFSFR
jgi:uncharacterized protein GlcG (DUF336 family)